MKGSQYVPGPSSGHPAPATVNVRSPEKLPSVVQNMSRLSLDTDNVFGDGWDAELADVTGDPAGGMTVALTIGVGEKSANTPPDGGPPPNGGPPPFGGPPPNGRRPGPPPGQRPAP